MMMTRRLVGWVILAFNRRTWVAHALAMMLALAAGSLAPAHAQQHEKYQGFDLFYRFPPGGNEDLKQAARTQVDIVVAIGLPPTLIPILQGVPVNVRAQQIGSGPRACRNQLGCYFGGRSSFVVINPDIVESPSAPVLLHEFMHAAHDHWLQGGFNNQQVTTLYREACRGRLFDIYSHMMLNRREYFAAGATTYLTGSTGQEPYTRDLLRMHQQDYFSYLQRLFGARAGTYTSLALPAPDTVGPLDESECPTAPTQH